MQTNGSAEQKYTAVVRREPEGNTLEMELKQKEIAASELNVHIKEFTEDNHINEVDSNSIQLVTEEIVIMVLLPKIPEGKALQYFISHNRKKGIITMEMKYPGEVYNPFEEDDIFMINIFRDWISDIQFSNPDNRVNDLVLTIQTEKQEVSEDIKKPVRGNKLSAPKREETFYGLREGAVAPGAINCNIRQDDSGTMEILIRDESIGIKTLHEYLERFFEKVDVTDRGILLDNILNEAERAVRAISKVLVFDILGWCAKDFSYMAYKISYVSGDEEIALRFRYPGNEYNPFVKNAESKGIKVISRQATVTTLFAYKEGINDMVVIFELAK